MFYLKKQNMLCFAPHQEDSKETEQEKVSFLNSFSNLAMKAMHCLVFQEALKNDADVESGKPIIKESAKIDPKIGANTDAKNTS